MKSKINRLFSKDGFGLALHYIVLETPLRFLVSDKQFVKLQYRAHVGSFLNLDTPRTFNDKINWIKLYDHNPLYTKMVDKYLVKEYVKEIIGSKYVIETLGVWNSFSEIDFDLLPNQFVLKTNHSGGNTGVVICKDKKTFNLSEAKRKLEASLQKDLYMISREWPYKNVKRKIIAEQYLQDPKNPNELSDYKFFCFDGEPRFCQVIRDRNTKETIDFYDMDWNHMPFVGFNSSVENGLTPVKKPRNMKELLEICRKLSCNLKFGRVDLYVLEDSIYFGEITLFPAGGMGILRPFEWNIKLGDLINL